MPVPNTFANATTSIPLSQLDANFATAITLGNTAIQLGNSVSTLNNMTFANVTVSSGSASVSSITDSGNLTFTGTGNRILGDFSNATDASRVSFQSSTTNEFTQINAIPNGTSQVSGFTAFNSSDANNAAYLRIIPNATEARLQSGITGTGTYLPMTFYTGGSERARILSGGNFLIGTTANSGGVNGFEARADAGAGNYAGAIVNTKTDNATATNGFLVKYTGVSPNDTNLIFLCQDSGNTNRFFVQNNGTTGGTSDASLKTNIVDATSKLNDLMNIKIRNFEWVGDQSHTKCLGVIAQEVEQVFPSMVSKNESGIKSVKHSVFIPILIKAVQELKEEVNSLRSELATLKGVK